MREHIFKAKCRDNGEWVKGSLLTYDDGDCFMCVEELKDVLNKYQVIPKTVCEYTGLTDKNGKKIFEGDAVRQYLEYVKNTYNNDYYDCGNVFWNQQTSRFMRTSTIFSDDVVMLESFVYEVLGNICDNPELLEVRA